ncbi:Mnr2 ion transporter [Candida orthopsilosis Co 90-125]|uniref:Mnr2 ion transporter n=1 Tax=Candida orthopsilosis (strain 90-125) TaxID=1136231 RepID=H8X7U0_CANO9|nr:Mnr2 ion transporter [Candida orthopsilosis Co 90-125]CCG23876.1 Mnr2 ion transporter [Candida orthopsilosis Co 90-125]
MDTPDRSVMEGSKTPTIRTEQRLNDHTALKNHKSSVNYTVEDSNKNKSTSSLERLINSGSYIDHRVHNDLAHLHSSPARSRRRSSNGNVFKRNSTTGKRSGNDSGNGNDDNTNSSKFTPRGPTHYATAPTLPLTNRNLQSLLRSSSSGGAIDEEQEAQSPTAIALDMDQFAHEQRQLARSQSWHNPFGKTEADLSPGSPGHYANIDYNVNGDDEFSVNSMEFGESNPSSDHSSDSTSLDDVCYYDYDREDEKRDEWPNLEVMEEYVVEELEEMEREKDNEREIDQVVQSVNFGKDVIHDGKNAKQANKYSPPRPPISALPEEALDEAAVDENTPLVDNYKVNEIESLDSLHDSFRIRPTPTQPWEKSKDQIPTILNKRQPSSQTQRTLRGQKKGELCRFTYFREDLPETIHAPSICGLLSDDPEISIHDRLVELFRPWEKVPTSESTSTQHPTHKQQDSLSSSNNNLQPTTKSSRLGNESPIPTSSGDSTSVEPYWLDILDPTEEEMKVISRTFGIHPLTTEDIFLGEAREKVELFKNYYFICFTSFDVVYERRKQKAKEQEKRYNKLQEMYENGSDASSLYGQHQKNGLASRMSRLFGSFLRKKKKPPSIHEKPISTSVRSRGKKVREGELSPLNMYIIVFKHAVITFHFSATPHPINVRRRARMLKDYLTVSSDWICYALIDDITDSFAPMIETIETEVNSIEDAILRMHSGEHEDSDDSDSEDEGSTYNHHRSHSHRHHKLPQEPHENVFVWRKRSKSTVDANNTGFLRSTNTKTKSKSSSSSSSTSDTGSSRILGWRRKGDMLRRIGECRKRVMSVLRLLSSKADVIKGFSKRFNDLDNNTIDRHQSEIAMYLGDIQDHIITMIGALNHYEKLLARFHSNYLAQINIDMTKVNNDTNDILGKVTILGTIVLPINVVTGLWGMNCLVPGQDYDGLAWFWCIIGCMVLFSVVAYNYAKRVTGL